MLTVNSILTDESNEVLRASTFLADDVDNLHDFRNGHATIQRESMGFFDAPTFYAD